MSVNSLEALVFMGLVFCTSSCMASRILVMHHFGASHFRDAQTLAAELDKNGHQATIVTSSKYALRNGSDVQTLLYDGSRFSEEFFKAFLWQWTHTGHFELGHLLQLFSLDLDICDAILSDQKLINEFAGFDLILGEYISWCPMFVAELINKPVVTYHVNTMTGAGRFLGLPLPWSYVPIQGFGFSDRMNFPQRFKNAVMRMVQEVINEFIATSMFDPLIAKYNISSSKAARDIMKQSELSLVFMDFVLDYPHPLLPHVVFVGPLLHPVLGSLPAEFEALFSNAGESGVVVVSFGAIIDELDSAIVNKMTNAFKNLKQAVIWKIKLPTFMRLPSNVITREWIPQAELLAHPQTKAFVTHCGSRSLYEAIYHAVPVVAVPLVADGFDNAERVVGRLRMGRRVSFLTATVSEWSEALEDVLGSKRYKENALRASALLKARKTSGLTAAMEWVNYTLACGGRLPHLHVAGLSMPWIILNSVDVVLALACVFVVVVAVFVWTCKLFCMCCGCKKRSSLPPVNKAKKKL